MQSNGLATFLLMIPVLTVPALAIFGIPQFAPVVASPLDEGRDVDRESRVGYSAKQPHDELFSDVDDFGSDAPRNSGAGSKRRERKTGMRRSEKAPAPSWADDLASDFSQPGEPDRTRSKRGLSDNDDSSPKRPLFDERKDKRSVPPKQPFADDRTSPQFSDELPVMPDDDSGKGASHRGLDEEGNSPRSRKVANKDRSPFVENHSPKSLDAAAEPLTWNAAVEKLNQYEIRNFRLEPGHQAGQFVFICTYTPPDSPRVSFRFEAEADQPLKAVEKVLEQIMERQRRR